MTGLDADKLRRAFLIGGAGEPAPVWRLAVDPATGTGSIAAGSAQEPAGGLPVACAVSIGAFDGLHEGHRALIAHLIEDARAQGLPAVAVTFDPDPDQVLPGTPAKRLLTANDRLRALAASGVDAVAVVPFTPELAALDHEAFFTRVLGPVLNVRAVHVGEDFRLGRGGASTVPVIAAWGAARGIAVSGHRLVRDGDLPVSATRIRRLLDQGRTLEAACELGRGYAVPGRVEHGRGQGTGMGFPTANIAVDAALQLPADGVYAGAVLAGGSAWPAAINAGLPPLFADDARSAHLEANLLGFSGDLYGQPVRVLFLERLRPMRAFPSVEALIAEVKRNIEQVRAAYGDEAVSCA